MLRLVIVDDEPLARRGLQQLLERCDEVAVVASVATLAAAVEAIGTWRPDGVLLDVALGQGQHGFDLLTQVAEPPPVIFISAHAQYAVSAFGVDAVDYLLKPIRPERLQEALQRLRRRLGVEPAEAPLVLRTPQRVLRAHLADIIVIRADGDYSHVHVEGQEPLMVLRSLATFVTELPQPPFLRAGRSWIVNGDRVQSVQRAGGGQAWASMRGLPQRLALSQAAAQRLQTWLAEGATTSRRGWG